LEQLSDIRGPNKRKKEGAFLEWLRTDQRRLSYLQRDLRRSERARLTEDSSGSEGSGRRGVLGIHQTHEPKRDPNP